MKSPDLSGACYIVILCLFIPWAAWHSRGRLKALDEAGAMPAPKRMYASSIVQLGLMGAFALIVGRTWHFEPFVAPNPGVRAWLIGAVVLVFNRAIMMFSRRWRTDEERRTMFVYRLAPRTASDIALFVAVAIAAGVFEEIAYRGVLFGLLAQVFGSPWPAYGIAIIVFTAAHAVQGLKSALAILVMTIGFHILVAETGTLVVAMVVHSLYDVIAGLAARREAIALETRAECVPNA